MDIDSIRDKLIAAFNLEENGFKKPTILIDSKVGFSTQKECEAKLAKKLKITDGKIYSTLIFVYIPIEKMAEGINRVPLVIRMTFDLFDNNKFFINDKFIKNKKNKPVGLYSRDEYFYDISNNLFYRKDQEIDAKKILEEIYELHIRPSRLFRGFVLRLRLKLKDLLAFSLKFLSNLFAFLLFLISGEKVTVDIIGRLFENKTMSNNSAGVEAKKGRQITLFDYQASFHSIIVYSAIHLIIFTLFFVADFRPKYLKIIFTNNFLTVLYVLVSLAIFENILPRLLNLLIRKFSEWYMKVAFMEIRL